MTEQEAGVPAVPGVTRWRKRPVEIEARLFDPGTDYDEACAVMLWCGARADDEGCEISTLEGVMLARSGDWIVKGVTGEFYPVKPAIFAATYEPADASPPVAAAFDPVPDTGGMTSRGPESHGAGSAPDDTGRALATAPDSAQERPWVSEGFRIRLARTMYDSLDRCPRCKVCEHQIGAAAKVMAEAVSAERERAVAAEGKLAAIAAIESWETCGATGADLVRVSDILAITGTEGKGDGYDRDFAGPVL